MTRLPKFLRMLQCFSLMTGMIVAVHADGTVSPEVVQLNTQIQAQLKQIQDSQQQQITTLNTQLQTQIQQMQAKLQEQIQTLNAQTQNQIKEVQTNLQTSINQVQEQVNQIKK